MPPKRKGGATATTVEKILHSLCMPKNANGVTFKKSIWASLAAERYFTEEEKEEALLLLMQTS